jgi:hypothetical protein
MSSHALTSWWSRLWHRVDRLTPEAEREAREQLIRALNGDAAALDAILRRERALLESREYDDAHRVDVHDQSS